MKIQGLNAKDFDCIERAFGYIIGEQLLHARGKAHSGDMQGCEVWLDAATEMIETYKKIQKAEQGYASRN